MPPGVFPRLGVLRSRRRRAAPRCSTSSAPTTRVFIEEPAMVAQIRASAGGTKSSSATSAPASARSSARRHLRLAMGARGPHPRLPGCELDQLGAVDVLESVTAPSFPRSSFATRPTTPLPRLRSRNIPRAISASAHAGSEARVLLAAPNQGEVERLAGAPAGVRHRLSHRLPRHPARRLEHRLLRDLLPRR